MKRIRKAYGCLHQWGYWLGVRPNEWIRWMAPTVASLSRVGMTMNNGALIGRRLSWISALTCACWSYGSPKGQRQAGINKKRWQSKRWAHLDCWHKSGGMPMSGRAVPPWNRSKRGQNGGPSPEAKEPLLNGGRNKTLPSSRLRNNFCCPICTDLFCSRNN